MKADVGNTVVFVREKSKIEGTVVKVYDNSVMVEISEEDMVKIKSPSTMTIVNHKKYSLKP